ncbi:hypothetical protein E2320_013960 [Naja naja]|nr:hypothetical protein E2320_013960 [Naja naja]
MAYPPGYEDLGSKHRARIPPVPQSPDAPQLFDDTSSFYVPYQAGYPSPGIDMIFADPVANVAMAYGSSFASQGKEIVHKEIHRFVAINKLKYFFAVDTTYVMKKLGLLIFPYMHKNWEVRYHRDSMAFITYILLAGMALGIQKRFSPEVLGMCASTAFVWMVMEVLALLLTLYIAELQSDLGTFDLLAYCGYKYVGMILTLVGGLVFGLNGGLNQTTGRVQMYITLGAAAFQPLVLYWLTAQLVH